MKRKAITNVTKLMIFKYAKAKISSEMFQLIVSHKKISCFGRLIAIDLLTFKFGDLDNLFIEYPSHKQLCKKYGVSMQSICRVIKELKDNNIIQVIYDRNGRTYKRKNFYLLLPYLLYGDYKTYIKHIYKAFDFDIDSTLKKIDALEEYRMEYHLKSLEDEMAKV